MQNKLYLHVAALIFMTFEDVYICNLACNCMYYIIGMFVLQVAIVNDIAIQR